MPAESLFTRVEITTPCSGAGIGPAVAKLDKQPRPMRSPLTNVRAVFMTPSLLREFAMDRWRGSSLGSQRPLTTQLTEFTNYPSVHRHRGASALKQGVKARSAVDVDARAGAVSIMRRSPRRLVVEQAARLETQIVDAQGRLEELEEVERNELTVRGRCCGAPVIVWM